MESKNTEASRLQEEMLSLMQTKTDLEANSRHSFGPGTTSNLRGKDAIKPFKSSWFSGEGLFSRKKPTQDPIRNHLRLG